MVTDVNALAEGLRLFQANDLQGARGYFEQAIREDAADGKAHGYLGIVLSRLGEMDRGISELQEAVRLQPADSGALYNLAVALVQVGRRKDARGALEHALGIDPANARVKAALEQLGPAVPAAPVYATQAVAYSPQANVPPAGPAFDLGPQTYGVQIPPYGTGRPVGTTYQPVAKPAVSSGTRIGRAMGWGALFAQIWTLYFILVAARLASFGEAGLDFGTLMAIGAGFYAVFGAALGLVIGAMDAGEDTAHKIGVVGCILVVGLQFAIGMRTGPGLLFGILFATWFGRFLGSKIVAKMNAA